MKKIVLIPDSFKGTLSSGEICQIMSEKIDEVFWGCKVCSVPVADGGEGSVDCFVSALGGEKVYIDVEGPFFEPVKAFYGILSDRKTAVVEMAACAGLPIVEDRKDPMRATTYGVGKLILDAAAKGCEKIIVGLGGSCTNDAGAGAAAAIGIKFFDKSGAEFVPTGGTLKDVCKIDASGKSKLLDGIEIISMCDIDNPLYGETGAAYVFAPQKGADEAMVKELDDGLRHISGKIMECLGMSVDEVAGGGAAGGFGAGMLAFFGSKLQSGINTVLETVGFDDMLSDTDLVFTGEGRLDSQSVRGKVISGVAGVAKKKGVPVIAVVGGAEDGIEKIYDAGVSAVFTINKKAEDFSVSRYKSKENLAFTVENILKLLKTFEKKA